MDGFKHKGKYILRKIWMALAGESQTIRQNLPLLRNNVNINSFHCFIENAAEKRSAKFK